MRGIPTVETLGFSHRSATWTKTVEAMEGFVHGH